MQLIIKKILFLFIATLFCFGNSTCKKVTKDHSEFVGEWSTMENFECRHFVNIDNNSRGVYGAEGPKGCHTSKSGKAKKGSNSIYIGSLKLHIVEAPSFYEDSMKMNYDSYYYTKVYGKMILKNSIFQGKETLTLYKIK